MRLLDDLVDEWSAVAAPRPLSHLTINRAEIHEPSCFDGGFYCSAQLSVTDLGAGTNDHARNPQICGLDGEPWAKRFG